MITSRATRSGCSTASRRPIGPPQSCTTNVASRRSRSSSSVRGRRDVAVVGVPVARPSACPSGRSPAGRAGSRGGRRRAPAAATLRHRKPHVGSPCNITTGRAVALVDVGEAQARRPGGSCGAQGKSGQALEQLVGRADGVGHPVGFYTVEQREQRLRVRATTVTWIAPGSRTQAIALSDLQPVEHELERERLAPRAVAARDVERPAGRVQRVVARRLAVAARRAGAGRRRRARSR